MNEWTNNWQQPQSNWPRPSAKLSTICSICGQNQFDTSSGITCINGHGGTDPASSNPLDAMNEDQLLLLWQKKKDAIAVATEEEMELRKYIVKREFPAKHEGMNTKDLGNGYQLKAGIKYNYNLADNDTVESCLDRISRLGNDGAFIADRLVSWHPKFKLTEYRVLQEDKEKGDQAAIKILNIVNDMLTIVEAAPTLEIKTPKAKK